MRRRVIPIYVILIASIVLTACGPGKNKEHSTAGEPAQNVIDNVTVETVRSMDAMKTRVLAGSVRAKNTSQVSARIMAQVLTVQVREGDHVNKGDVLIRLDDRELSAKVRQAEGGLKQAEAQHNLSRTTLDRYRSLFEGRAVSKQELDTIESQTWVAAEAANQARAAVDEARTWLGFAEIHSPVNGWVVRKTVEPGSTAAPGMPLIEIESEGHFQVEVPVDTTLSKQVVQGSELNVAVEAAGYSGQVRVSEVVPSVDPASRTFIVRADLPNVHTFRSGQFAEIRMNMGHEPVTAIPATALIHRGQIDGVYVVEGPENRIRFRMVKIGGEISSGNVEVLSGLEAGERIVTSGASTATEGASVKVRERNGLK